MDDQYSSISYTDYVNQDAYLYCWGFHHSAVKEMGEDQFSQHLCSIVLKSLSDIKHHKNKRIRERAFTIWLGSYNELCWVAVPGKMSSDTAIIIQNRLRGLHGYYGSDFAYNDVMRLRPFLRYDYGKVVWYDERLAGIQEYAKDEHGNDDLLIIYHHWLPSSLIGKEIYCDVLVHSSDH